MLEIIVKYDNFELERGLIQDVSFTDNLTGVLDEITVQIGDPSHRWFSGWVPKKNDRLTFEARLDGVRLSLPDFFVDFWDLTGWPGSTTLKAVSEATQGTRNNDSGKDASELRKKRTATYFDVTLRNVVSAIAQRNGITMLWEGEDTQAAPVLRQKNTSDLAFLSRLAQQTGRLCKLQNGYLIFSPLTFSGTTLERFGDTVRLVPGNGKRNVVIRPSDMTTPPKISHTGVVPSKKEFRRYQPLQARLDKVRGEADDSTFDGGVDTAANLGFGTESACWSAALEAHLSGVTTTFGVLPRVDIAAGSVVYLDQLGTYTGTYLIQKLTHKIGTSGWGVDIEAARISAANLTPLTTAQKMDQRFRSKADPAKTNPLDAVMNWDAARGDAPEWHDDEDRLTWITDEEAGVTDPRNVIGGTIF